MIYIHEAKNRGADLIHSLLTIWESSVRATHFFLSDSEIENIKQYVPQALQNISHLLIAKNEDGAEWESRYPHETVAICGLLHDVCKIDFYKQDFRNVKENGEWVKKPCFVREEALPFGHGEKSVYIVNGFIRLTREEAMAINWHMGGFDSRARGGDGSVSEAYAKYPLAVLLHVSDLEATYIDEKRGAH